MKNHTIAILSIFTFFSQICFAQNDVADSLLKLAETSSGIKKAKLFNEVAKFLFNSNPEASAGYAEKALEISKMDNNKSEQYYSMVNIGTAWSFAGKNEKALEIHLRALEKFATLINAEELGNLHNELGIDYNYQHNYE